MYLLFIILMLFGGFSGSLGSQSKANDVERETDIKALHGQVEAYYAQEGRYPTLGNLNDTAWRQKNMLGLDEEALKDPEWSASVGLCSANGKPTLANTPSAKCYSYAVGPAGCNNIIRDCAEYTLTATKKDGSTYQKQNLN